MYKIKNRSIPVQEREKPITCPSLSMRPGDKYTIAGVGVTKRGKFTMRCKPGMESVFTVVANVTPA